MSIVAGAVTTGLLLLMCGRVEDGAHTAMTEATDAALDGGDEALDLSSFTRACSVETSPLHLLPVLAPTTPPDFWAARKETLDFSTGNPEGGTWSATISDSVGTLCATASANQDCEMAFASYRVIGPDCQHPFDAGGGIVSTCSTEYLVATRGNTVSGIAYYADNSQAFVNTFGAIHSWQSAAFVLLGPIVPASTCSDPFPLSYRPAGVAGFEILVPTQCQSGVRGYTVLRVAPSGAWTKTFSSCD